MQKYIYILGCMAIFLGGSITSLAAEVGNTGTNGILINHAISGAILSAPNYQSGKVPDGIGIPHTLINSLSEGDYFAVVFFDGLPGCPSDNYEINSFRANAYWGYDIRGPMQGFSKASRTAAGGCMQEFHVNPSRGDDWLWGAISNTGTSSAITDTAGIPAFAICATAQACDPIIPHASTEVPPPSVIASTGGVSSVLFLPGIKGSKLYENNPLCLIQNDDCDIPLWLPLTDATTPRLFLDESGNSTSNAYVKEGGILASAFGQHFYDAFSAKMNSYAAQEHAASSTWSWKPIAYDWRMSLPNIVTKGTQHGTRIYYEESTSTPYIEQSLRSLAASSPTGKVTIIAHSNGGLVAKALMQKIGDTDASKLIDKVVFVGVPQSGAPQSIASLLYGDSENLPGTGPLPNALLSLKNARTFSLNSPMAYHLLPSNAYFRDVQDANHPVVQFSDSALYPREHAAYGNGINSWNELMHYARADEQGRAVPAAGDLHNANVLNPELLNYADATHAVVDAWAPPPGVMVHQIAGWGDDTLSGIEMYEQQTKLFGGTRTQRSYRPMFIEDGDGTVPVPSALMMGASGQTSQYWVDLLAGLTTRSTYSHGTLLESPNIEELIGNIIEGRASSTLPSGISMTQPQNHSSQKKLLFVIHGPATLSVTGSHGTIGTTKTLGETSYALVPADDTYTARVTGVTDGNIDLDVEEILEGIVTTVRTIAGVPVSASSTASIVVPPAMATTSVLNVDDNNDGVSVTTATFGLGSTLFAPDDTSSSSPTSTPAVLIPTVTTPVAIPPIVSSSGAGGGGGTSAVQPRTLPAKAFVTMVIPKTPIFSGVLKATPRSVLKVIKKRLVKGKARPATKKKVVKLVKKRVCSKTYCPISARKIPVTKKVKGPAKK